MSLRQVFRFVLTAAGIAACAPAGNARLNMRFGGIVATCLPQKLLAGCCFGQVNQNNNELLLKAVCEKFPDGKSSKVYSPDFDFAGISLPTLTDLSKAEN